MYIVGRGFLTPLFYENHLPPSSVFSQRGILLNDVTYLHLPSLGTSVPEALCHMFYATRRQVYCRFDTDDMT